ncbi:peptidoglycan DD-metalloendopeptidase family protein [bacterium]|nr:peptidoglycan DD-metalloendopeptidase family protein [bacterium]
MKNKHFNLIILTEDGSKPLSWRINKKVFYFLVSILGFLIVLVIGGAFFYGKLTQKALEASYLRKENQMLRKRENKIAEIEVEMAKLNEIRKHIERLIEIDDNYTMRDLPTHDYEFQFGIKSYPQALVAKEGEILIGKELDEWLKQRKAEKELMPTGLPASGLITARFGEMQGFLSPHTGIDIALKEGTPVRATASGIVEYADWHSRYGNLITINHLNGYKTKYGHASEILVEVGQWIKNNQTICLSGNTGKSLGPHLHYEVQKNNMPIDPLKMETESSADSSSTAEKGDI